MIFMNVSTFHREGNKQEKIQKIMNTQEKKLKQNLIFRVQTKT